MDEVEALRELYGEPQADPFLKARVRAKVRARVEAGSLRRRRPRLPWAPAVAGLAAVAAAVAVAVAAVVPGTAGAPGTGAAGPQAPGSRAPGSQLPGSQVPESRAPVTTVSGRSVLLAAASTAASEPAAGGAYWRVRKLYRETHPERLGRGANRYWLVESRLTEQWVAGDGRVWSGSRTLGAQPRSAADEAAWRRDGSPATWSSQGSVLSTAPQRGRLEAATGRVPFSMAGRELTFEQIQALPSDAAALRDWVSAVVRQEAATAGTADDGTENPEDTAGTENTASPKNTAGPGNTAGPEDTAGPGDLASGALDGMVADALSGLLWSKPSPPAVRAAAYRALADLPNVRYLGETSDERGRRGVAFSFDLRAGGAVRRTLIIDPRDSQVLSSTLTGLPGSTGDRVEVVLSAGWTDDEPAPPGLP
ncbi:hypothetical protein ACFFMN_04910 [Planobispora siamensis]|uniref:CU044_5270 family protein n=1 Tax=Planobispora siamensis TaxID=936338 RepID=A0A8J3WK27_9ACTN|nr:hypothetical protein [Planobispora siamensis]GIH92298.1 hypothetical protein Psi01_29280 [Planobispora siamensis]